MNFKLCRDKIEFMETIAKVCSLFGLIPFYNFQKHELVHTKLFKCMSWVLLQLIVMHLLIHGISSNGIHDQCFAILAMVQDASSVTFISTTIISTLWYMPKWQAIFSGMCYLEGEIHKNVGNRCTIFLKNANFLFLVGILHIIVTVSITYIYFGSTYYYMRLIAVSFSIMLSNIVYNIILSLKDKYEKINILLCTFKCSNIFNLGVAEHFRKIKILLLAMNDVTEDINGLFGYSLLFQLIYGISKILVVLTFFIFGLADLIHEENIVLLFAMVLSIGLCNVSNKVVRFI